MLGVDGGGGVERKSTSRGEGGTREGVSSRPSFSAYTRVTIAVARAFSGTPAQVSTKARRGSTSDKKKVTETQSSNQVHYGYEARNTAHTHTHMRERVAPVRHWQRTPTALKARRMRYGDVFLA